MLSKISRYYHTIKYLKLSQLAYQFYYRIKKNSYIDCPKSFTFSKIQLNIPFFPAQNTLQIGDAYEYQFLNKAIQYTYQIDWNDNRNGKLWTFHLNYFDFLSQSDLEVSDKISIIKHYYEPRFEIKDGMEPYPISLRGINLIKFAIMENVHEFDHFIYSQYAVLFRRLEYHLLGNHLLENAISLLFASIYFQNERWENKALEILKYELSEQILDDGAHYELSPMYHSIILYRIADLYNLLSAAPKKSSLQNIADLLRTAMSKMLGWLEVFSFENDQLAWVNDASPSMIPVSIEKLANYLHQLGIQSNPCHLSDSGYRRVNTGPFQLLADIGQIGPDYIPGHAHADTFNFVLYIDGNPLIVDVGISTYENNDRRAYERSTLAHNTVTVNGLNSSEVWSSFRVAKRAKVVILEDKNNSISAMHNGYIGIGVQHRRSWLINDKSITVIDIIFGRQKTINKAFFHFDCNVNISLENNIIISNLANISFSGDIVDISLEKFYQALGFNDLIESNVVIVEFINTLTTQINYRE